MVRTRKAIYVGNQEVQRRYIGNKLIFENLGDIDNKDKVSGTEIFTDKADNSVVHVEVDGVIGGLNDFDVVSSVGKRNYISNSDGKWESISGGSINKVDGALIVGEIISSGTPRIRNISLNGVRLPETILVSFEAKADVSESAYIDLRGVGGAVYYTPSKEWKKFNFTINSENSTLLHFYFFIPGGIGDKLYLRNVKVEFGTLHTDWTPAPEDITENDNHPLIDKINLSLSEPLRSVDDMHDRLFRDTDGLWKVERNVHTSGVEILSQEMQDKLNNLRSFEDSNYVYTVVDETDISPTLHATFKSEGWYDNYQNTLLK